MATTYNGNSANITAGSSPSVTIPQDGDPVAASSVSLGADGEADYLAYLNESLNILATTTGTTFTLPCAQNGYLFAAWLSSPWLFSQPTGISRGTDPEVAQGSLNTGVLPGSPAGPFLLADNGSNLLVVMSTAAPPLIFTTPDLTTWTARSHSLGNFSVGPGLWASSLATPRFIFPGNVAGAACAITSLDGITWANTSTGLSGTSLSWATHGNGVVVGWYDGDTAHYYTSSNGTSWTQRLWPSAAQNNKSRQSVVFGGPGGNKFFFYALNNHVFTSTDGISWTDQGAQTLVPICATFNDRLYLGLAQNNPSYFRYLTSKDGINWKSRVSNITFANAPWVLASNAAHGNRFVVGSYVNTIFSVTSPISPP